LHYAADLYRFELYLTVRMKTFFHPRFFLVIVPQNDSSTNIDEKNPPREEAGEVDL
jgi:hypothetical protein